MREVDRPSYLYLAGAAAEELRYGFRNMANSFRQRHERDPEKGQAYLLATQAALPEDNPYCTREEILNAKYLKSGFHAAVYKFTSSTGEWVIKVGMKKSPERAPHPSSEEFTTWYSSVLDQEREIFKDSLPYLIPEPQTVLHVQTEEHDSSTVILQPFIKGIIPLDKIKTLPIDDQEKLLNELSEFKRCHRAMDEKYGIRLDFWRAGGNFVIGQINGSHHLVFLDNGPFKKTRTPIFYKASEILESIKLGGIGR